METLCRRLERLKVHSLFKKKKNHTEHHQRNWTYRKCALEEQTEANEGGITVLQHFSSMQSVLFHLCSYQLMHRLDQDNFQSKSQNTETEWGWEICFHGNCAVSLAWLVHKCVCFWSCTEIFKTVDSQHFAFIIHRFRSQLLKTNHLICCQCFKNDATNTENATPKIKQIYRGKNIMHLLTVCICITKCCYSDIRFLNGLLRKTHDAFCFPASLRVCQLWVRIQPAAAC